VEPLGRKEEGGRRVLRKIIATSAFQLPGISNKNPRGAAIIVKILPNDLSREMEMMFEWIQIHVVFLKRRQTEGEKEN
jgi:hypothetical protein